MTPAMDVVQLSRLQFGLTAMYHFLFVPLTLGLSILLGYHAKIGAWLIALFLVGVTPMMHRFWGVSDPMMAQTQMIMFMKNASMLGAALIITQLGSGPWSLDARGK